MMLIDIAYSKGLHRQKSAGIEVLPAPLWKLLMVAFGAPGGEHLSCDLFLLKIYNQSMMKKTLEVVLPQY